MLELISLWVASGLSGALLARAHNENDDLTFIAAIVALLGVGFTLGVQLVSHLFQ